jgi:hypothetical protein
LGDGSRCGLVLEVKGGSPHVKDAKPEPEITIAIPQPDDYKPSPVTHEPCSPATLGEIGKTWTIQPKALLSHFGLWGSTPRTAYYTSSDMNILNPSFNGSFPQQPPTREKKKRPAMSLPPGG